MTTEDSVTGYETQQDIEAWYRYYNTLSRTGLMSQLQTWAWVKRSYPASGDVYAEFKLMMEQLYGQKYLELK